MCGIFGIFNHCGLTDDHAALCRGNDIAAHRGPDGAGAVWFDTRVRHNSSSRDFVQNHQWTGDTSPTLLLCHRRLAIIDLSEQGRQPMSSSDGMLWITYNGEIYNYLELRTELRALGAVFRTVTDTEVVLKAYEVWGPEAVTRFVGMWGLVILDLRGRRLVASRDRFGVKPLHYHTAGATFVFGSEIKQLLEVPSVPHRVNEHVVYDYLQYEAVDNGSETFFDGIRKLRAGHNLIIPLDGGEIIESRYYMPLAAGVADRIGRKEAAEQFRALFRESIRIHLRADVPVGTCLSGGLDSSSIAILMREIALEEGIDVRRHSFSCHFDAPEANELEYTNASIAAAQTIPHFVEPNDHDIESDLRKLVWHQDEPFGSTSIFAQWLVFRLVHQNGVKVVLDGQGADEMLGGYAATVPYFFRELAARGRMLRLLRESYSWSQLQGMSWLPKIPIYRLQERLLRLVGRVPTLKPDDEPWINSEFLAAQSPLSAYIGSLNDRPFGDSAHFANVLYQFFYLSNLPGLLRYEERNSMAFSVESRVPFLDHRLVDFVFTVPSDLKIRNGYTKSVLRDAMAGTLPEKIRLRGRKMGFATPERHWQAGVLRPLILDAIDSPLLRPYIWKEQALRHLARTDKDGTLSFAPWRWLNLALWLKEFRLT